MTEAVRVFRILTILLILAALFIGGRFLWAKYHLGQKDVTLNKVLEDTKKDLSLKAIGLDQQLGKILGESEAGKELESYISQELPQVIKDEIEESKIIKQVQEEVIKIVSQTTEKVKDLPEEQTKKLKKEIKEEICEQLLKEEE